MEEKTIIYGKRKDSKLICMSLPFIGAFFTVLYDCLVSPPGRLYYGFSFMNGANYVLYPLIVVLAIVGAIIYIVWSKVQISITTKRVYGFNAVGKRVDLPLDSISAIGIGMFKRITVSTSSGAISFPMIENRDEIYKALSDLLIARQEKTKAATTIKQEVSQSNADELKKYKDLLDCGVITQEEFNAKKKQLLGV